MRFSLNFINEFLKVTVPPQSLVSLLTMAGMEVEHFEECDGDWVFDIEVTSNRYDWLSMIGITREIAACLHKPFTLKYPVVTKKPLLGTRRVVIQDLNDCPLYVGRALRSLTVKESPAYVRERITHCGINAINNIVDSTNYSMLVWGNPLHAFDEDKIEGTIYVRRAAAGEVFIGIDEQERLLSPENLVIADEKKIIALAGVMGAKNTEVDNSTKNVFLEAAIFSPLAVRRSRRCAGLDTDSSYRFERKVSADYLEYASSTAAQMMQELAAGLMSGYTCAGQKPRVAQKKITVSLAALNSYLGDTFPKEKVRQVLTGLDFKVENAPGQNLRITVPSFRLDVEREVDVYEEFIRIYGYDKITCCLPFLLGQPYLVSTFRFKNELRHFLSTVGLKEIITFSIEADKELSVLGYHDVIKLTNPLRGQENALRPTLLTGAIKSVRYNVNRAQENIRFFELANVYQRVDTDYREAPALSIAVSIEKESLPYLKRVIEELLQHLNVSSWAFVETKLPNFTNALSIVIDKKEAGFLGVLDQAVKKEFELKKDFMYAQLDVECLQSSLCERHYQPFSAYPATSRDISIAFKKDIKFREIERMVKEKGEYIVDMRIVNTYEGKDLPQGYQAFTLRLFYQSDEKTLTSGEVDTLHSQIRSTLAQAQGVILR
ncbi:MAG: phenylalanine--tRNA ligase subunit beta [Candidatus Omnitrophica bacterium]|nr:phenylalanine--tRNA ligase subunit beta [Candidatus Omnitrophota bacterium]